MQPAHQTTNRQDDSLARAQAFESLRPLLFSIAYRMTGSASEAEDVVQESYLRYHATPGQAVQSVRAYLSTIVTRLSLDYLKSARRTREQYLGPWLPEPVLTGVPDGVSATVRAGLAPVQAAEQRESISMAFLVLLESLSPPERAVLVLHEAFDYSHEEIATILGKTAAACRQSLRRAQTQLAAGRQRFEAPPEAQRRLTERFMAACLNGDVPALTTLLAQDVVSWSDGGGKATAARRPVVGRDAVIRFIMGLVRKAPPNASLSIGEVNGGPAIFIWVDGALMNVMSPEFGGGTIAGLRSVLNPDKLAYIARQLGVRLQATISPGQVTNVRPTGA